jgi:hypothetical protein
MPQLIPGTNITIKKVMQPNGPMHFQNCKHSLGLFFTAISWSKLKTAFKSALTLKTRTHLSSQDKTWAEFSTLGTSVSVHHALLA